MTKTELNNYIKEHPTDRSISYRVPKELGCSCGCGQHCGISCMTDDCDCNECRCPECMKDVYKTKYNLSRKSRVR
jgi:hypothetical protein